MLTWSVLQLVLRAEGQSPNGNINGLVLDPTNRVIAGAEIIVVNDVTVEQKQTEQKRAAERKRLVGLNAECAPFIDGSPEKIQAKTMSLPPKECREILSWMRDAYLDALYDLHKQSR
jgi:hypothetical protein